MYYITKETRTSSELSNIFNGTTLSDTYYMINTEDSTYKTYQTRQIKNKITMYESTLKLLGEKIKAFLKEHPNPSEMYKHYKIPKASGGFRDIDEPEDDLKELQREIADTLQSAGVYTTEWAYAYVSRRSAIDMAEKHKNAKFVLKLDLKNFFPSIDAELLKTHLMNNYAITLVNEFVNIDDIIKIALLDNGLPQGSPLSPYLSNLVMVDFDYRLRNAIAPSRVYTRYADDIIISSEKYISKHSMTEGIKGLLEDNYDRKIKLNYSKIKLLKNTQRLYIVGVKLNKDNELTFGHEKKKKLKLDLYNLFKAYEQHTACKEEAQELLGLFTYMKQIEPEYANYLERKLLKQFNSTAKTIYKHFKF